MHILLDARPFESGISVENGIYCEDFFQALFRNFPSDIFYIWTAGKKRSKNMFSFALEKYPNAKEVHTPLSGAKIEFLMKNFSYPKVDDIAETQAMKKGILPWIGKFDAAIFLAPFTAPVEDNCLKIICINDFSELHFPEYFSIQEKKLYTKSNYKREISNSDVIVTPSHFVQDDLIKTFGVEEEKTYVLGSGIIEREIQKNDDILKTEEEKLAEHEQDEKVYNALPEKFFFARGIFSQLNNFSALLKAFTLFQARFGEKSWALVVEEEKLGDLKNSFNNQKNCIALPPLTHHERIEVLEKAQCFLYPSLYDGVGHPVLEAMRYGCPVASSHFGALPEVFGEVAISFDPTSHLSILKAMKRFFSESKIRENLSEAGKEWSYDSKFLWDDIAERFMHLIQEKREEKDEELENEE